MTEGQVAYSYLGIEVQPFTRQTATQHDLPVDIGVYVVAIEPDGPAAQAGIEVGDIIVAIDGQRIDQENAFAELFFAHQPGERVPVVFLREGQEQEAEVTLVERPPD